MADTKISAETSAGALTGAEIVPVVRGTGSPPTYSNLRTTTQAIANLAAGGGGGLWAPIITVPTSASTGLTTWVNQGSATVNDRSVGISLSAPPVSGDSLRMRSKAAPAASARGLIGVSTVPSSIGLGGLGFYDGTKIHTISISHNSGWFLEVLRWTNATTFSTSNFHQPLMSNPVWLQVRYDGTNVYFDWSVSGDSNDFINIYTEAISGGWLANRNNVVLFSNRSGTSPATNTIATLFAYAEI